MNTIFAPLAAVFRHALAAAIKNAIARVFLALLVKARTK